MSNAVSTTWPSGSTNAGWPQEPTGMLMPGRIQGWPAGTQRAANPATTLLSQAVAWWDVDSYRDGDRFLRNRGTGGELLDLRLGSSVAANSNDPRFLAPEDGGYVYLPGVSGNYLSAPDEAALDITGDLDLRIRVGLDSWAASASNTFIAKDDASTNRSFNFDQVPAGSGSFLRLRFGGTGSTFTHTATASVAPSFAAGDVRWLRVTLDADNGSSQAVVTFYTAPDSATMPTSWDQFGTVQTLANAATSFVGTAALTVGMLGTASNPLSGKVYAAQVRSGIDGTTVLDIDCDAITSGSATSFTALTNQTVTVNRSTSGRKSVAVPSRHKGGKPVMLLGSDDFLEVQDSWQHGLLNFDTGQPYTVLWVGRQWTGAVSINARMTKGGSNSAGPGWVMSCLESTGRMDFNLGPSGSVYLTSSATPSPAFGQVVIATAVRNGVFNGLRFTANTVTGTNLSTLTGQETASTGTATRIGTTGGLTNYGNFEWYAAAVWRRALTNAEVTSLNSYYSGRIA